LRWAQYAPRGEERAPPRERAGAGRAFLGEDEPAPYFGGVGAGAVGALLCGGAGAVVPAGAPGCGGGDGGGAFGCPAGATSGRTTELVCDA
jgi:hypothetical protein